MGPGLSTPARKSRVVEAFSSAASYDDFAIVQRKVAQQLADRIAGLGLRSDAEICEIGCGTGFLGQALGDRLPHASWLATDISTGMLERAKERLRHDRRFSFALLDADDPKAFSEQRKFDLICSNFAAQWFCDLRAVLERLSCALKPGGRLLLTTLAKGTFREWREAHEDCDLTPGTPPYPSVRQLADMRPRGLGGEVRCDEHMQAFCRPYDFLHALRAIGADTAGAHAPLSAGQMRRVLRRFEAAGSKITYVVALFDFELTPEVVGCA